MKLICLIDSLGSGGAQRQMATLAVGLKKRGHEVRVLVYHDQDHFLPLLEAVGIHVETLPPCSIWRRKFLVRRVLGRGCQDVVLAFLEGPCLYAELARLPRPRWALVVGERSSDPRMKRGRGWWVRQFHRLADAVITNSHTNRLMLEAAFPCLTSKLSTIYNTVDLRRFSPAACPSAGAKAGAPSPLRLVVVASYQANKNMLNVAKALLRLKSQPGSPAVEIDWFGDVPPADTQPFEQAEQFIAESGLAHVFRLHEATRNIETEYARAGAVGLFSLYEGLPNVVCEGMASGKPILLSHVCDAGNLVHEGKNGFLCDPGSPDSIADSIRRLTALTEQERLQMGQESRRMAEALFDETVVVARYESVLEAAVRRDRVLAKPTEAIAVPETARRTVKQWIEEG